MLRDLFILSIAQINLFNITLLPRGEVPNNCAQVLFIQNPVTQHSIYNFQFCKYKYTNDLSKKRKLC